MKQIKKILLSLMSVFMLFGLNTVVISANENNNELVDLHVIYCDLDDENLTISAVQAEFNNGADIVQVINVDNQATTRAITTGWKENTQRFYYSDIAHGSQGTIRGFLSMNGTVSQVTFNVETWGTGLSLVNKAIYNNNTTSVYGLWSIKITGFMNYYSPNHTVSLL